MGDICKELKVIPQFVGSCWFNSFLMAILYSENARKVMINYSKKWDKKDKFFNNYNKGLIITLLITLWPFSPGGNFFNNWILIIYTLPLSFYINENLTNRKSI